MDKTEMIFAEILKYLLIVITVAFIGSVVYFNSKPTTKQNSELQSTK